MGTDILPQKMILNRRIRPVNVSVNLRKGTIIVDVAYDWIPGILTGASLYERLAGTHPSIWTSWEGIIPISFSTHTEDGQLTRINNERVFFHVQWIQFKVFDTFAMCLHCVGGLPTPTLAVYVIYKNITFSDVINKRKREPGKLPECC